MGDEVWAEVEKARLRLADFLDGLSDEEWSRPSLCAGWRVGDVAAHLTLPPVLGMGGWLAELVRSRGDFHRMIRESALRKASRLPRVEIVGQLREHAGSRKVPPAPGADSTSTVMDVLTHTLDVSIPLGRTVEIPPEAARAGLGSLWKLRFPFNPRKVFAGVRMVADDSGWDVGAGPEVTGPTSAFLLLLTNRPAAYERLSGPGLDVVRARVA